MWNQPVNQWRLVLDVGNTETDFALFNGNVMRRQGAIPNTLFKNEDDVLPLLPHSPDQIWVGSVHPKLSNMILKKCHSQYGKSCHRINHPLPASIRKRIQYYPVESLGIDRIADVVGGYSLYGGPLLIIDCGTATTLNMVDNHGCFMGGLITLGLESWAHAMKERLPHLWQDMEEIPSRSKQVLAKSTSTALRAGLWDAYSSMIEGLVARIEHETNCRNYRLVVTGGWGLKSMKNSRLQITFNPSLTLLGYFEIAKEMEKFHE